MSTLWGALRVALFFNTAWGLSRSQDSQTQGAMKGEAMAPHEVL